MAQYLMKEQKSERESERERERKRETVTVFVGVGVGRRVHAKGGVSVLKHLCLFEM
jgi:hypothetical protein